MTTLSTAFLNRKPCASRTASRSILRYLRRNKSLVIGLLIMFVADRFHRHRLADDRSQGRLSAVGPHQAAAQLQVPASAPTSSAATCTPPWWLACGRRRSSAVWPAPWAPLIGVVLGFISAYFGGWIDTIIKGVCQILTPIPAFLIQVIIAGSLDKRDVTIYTMAFIVVLLSWMGPTLVIRSQVLSMKERQFVSVAKLSGMGDLGIIFKEILPNLLPFIAAAFVGQVFAAHVRLVLPGRARPGPAARAAAGQHHLGRADPGRLLQRLVVVAASCPRVAMVLILGSLALINMGLDELANPRVRRTE